jgi:glycosyltransferase involved in cell wall biosynthesis
MEYSLVVPFLNEESSLPFLHRRISVVMDSVPGEYEIIYVNDGSTDASLEVLRQATRCSDLVRVISFPENIGKNRALLAALGKALGEWIITIDADLQIPPEEISTLMRHKNTGDLITGYRVCAKDNFFKKVLSRAGRGLSRSILGDITKDPGCSIRLFKRHAAAAFAAGYLYFPFMARMMGFSVTEIPVKHGPRVHGKSKYRPAKKIREGLGAFMGMLSYLRSQRRKY